MLVRNANNACTEHEQCLWTVSTLLAAEKKYLFSASENQFAEKKDRFPFYFKCKHFTIILLFSDIQKKTRIFPHSKYIGRKYASLAGLKMQNVKLSITGVRAPISPLHRSSSSPRTTSSAVWHQSLHDRQPDIFRRSAYLQFKFAWLYRVSMSRL